MWTDVNLAVLLQGFISAVAGAIVTVLMTRLHLRKRPARIMCLTTRMLIAPTLAITEDKLKVEYGEKPARPGRPAPALGGALTLSSPGSAMG